MKLSINSAYIVKCFTMKKIKFWSKNYVNVPQRGSYTGRQYSLFFWQVKHCYNWFLKFYNVRYCTLSFKKLNFIMPFENFFDVSILILKIWRCSMALKFSKTLWNFFWEYWSISIIMKNMKALGKGIYVHCTHYTLTGPFHIY